MGALKKTADLASTDATLLCGRCEIRLYPFQIHLSDIYNALFLNVCMQACQAGYIRCALLQNSSNSSAACNCSRQFLVCLEAAHCRDAFTAEQVCPISAP